MSAKTRSVSRSVQFECEARTANAVMLVGDFNQWSMVANPMRRGEDGTWIASLDLAPGRYEYKFMIDGCWCCEPGEPDECRGGSDRVPNAHGTMNRVIEVQ